MGIRDLNIKDEYRSNVDDIVKDFYIPLLSSAVSYKRSVGFFSSSSLIAMTKGIVSFLENDGKIQIVASHKLSENDIENIKDGYELRDIIKEKLKLSLQEVSFERDLEKLNILSYLIEQEVLDIKIAFVGNYGMFHEKVGIIQDQAGDIIAFSGSMNESLCAYKSNYESFDVFKSWDSTKNRVNAKVTSFEKIWNNKEKGIKVFPFTKELIPILKKYQRDTINYDIDIEDYDLTLLEAKENYKHDNCPKLPEDLVLRDYQLDAIDKWFQADCKGILSMATGTGKTLTALGALTRLFEQNGNCLAIIIVCPYKHLVEQWAKDVRWFNMTPIVGYSSSTQKKWKELLQTKINNFEHSIADHFCFITTNATFTSDFVNKQFNKISDNLLIIADEAHNLGANHISKRLLKNTKYRLALSATIQRHNDDEGTQKLFDYFKTVCYEYSLSQAIENDMLVNYKYYPIPISLTTDELNDYKEISVKISKLRFDEKKHEDLIKNLLIKRAKIIAGASNKLVELKKLMQIIEDKRFMLVYCGTARNIFYPTDQDEDIEPQEKRQINQVTQLLGNYLNLKTSKFTSEETMEERESIIDNFEQGRIDAIVAIKCLDEGVDIPAIRTAIILASSTNPKEYIQRRGRVLRKCSNKNFATIYDFVTLPCKLDILDEAHNFDRFENNLGLYELNRIKEFSEDAINSAYSKKLIYKLNCNFTKYKG